MSLPCRTVLEGGQKDIQVSGPMGSEGLQDIEEEIVKDSEEWWQEHQ